MPCALTAIGAPFWESTSLPCPSTSRPWADSSNCPSRVYWTPCGVRTAKKPVPAMPKSSGCPVECSAAGVRSVTGVPSFTPVLSEPICWPVAVLASSSEPKLCWTEASVLYPGVEAFDRSFAS